MRYAKLVTAWASICAGLGFAAHSVAAAWGQGGGAASGPTLWGALVALALCVAIPLYLRGGT